MISYPYVALYRMGLYAEREQKILLETGRGGDDVWLLCMLYTLDTSLFIQLTSSNNIPGPRNPISSLSLLRVLPLPATHCLWHVDCFGFTLIVIYDIWL